MDNLSRKIIDTLWDRNTRNDINVNFEFLFKGVSDFKNMVTDEVIDEVMEHSKLNWGGRVDTFEDLPDSPEVGAVHFVNDTGIVYRWDGSEWVDIQEIDASILHQVEDRLNKELSDVNRTVGRLENRKTIAISTTDEGPGDADIWFEVVE